MNCKKCENNWDYLKAGELEVCYLCIGDMYLNGDGVVKDENKAIEYFKKAFNEGDIPAIDWIAGVYFDKNEYEKALKYINIGIEYGRSYCMKLLGFIYEEEEKYEKAFEQFKKSSDLGDIESKKYLAQYYIEGLGVEKSLVKGIKILEDLLEYYTNHPDKENDEIDHINNYLDSKGAIFLHIGKIYYDEENYAEALKNYEMVIIEESNHSFYAYERIGRMYHLGKGVERNYEKAVENYEKAGQLGNSFALERLAKMYQAGRGVEKNLDKANELLEQSEIIRKNK